VEEKVKKCVIPKGPAIARKSLRLFRFRSFRGDGEGFVFLGKIFRSMMRKIVNLEIDCGMGQHDLAKILDQFFHTATNLSSLKDKRCGNLCGFIFDWRNMGLLLLLLFLIKTQCETRKKKEKKEEGRKEVPLPCFCEALLVVVLFFTKKKKRKKKTFGSGASSSFSANEWCVCYLFVFIFLSLSLPRPLASHFLLPSSLLPSPCSLFFFCLFVPSLLNSFLGFKFESFFVPLYIFYIFLVLK
jgi:hypothetical protein